MQLVGRSRGYGRDRWLKPRDNFELSLFRLGNAFLAPIISARALRLQRRLHRSSTKHVVSQTAHCSHGGAHRTSAAGIDTGYASQPIIIAI